MNSHNEKEELPYIFGELIGCLLVLAVYLSVPVLIIATCIKVLFF